MSDPCKREAHAALMALWEAAGQSDAFNVAVLVTETLAAEVNANRRWWRRKRPTITFWPLGCAVSSALFGSSERPHGLSDDLVRRLVLDDPIFREAYEGFNDGCVFCGSRDLLFDGPVLCRHEPDCAWMEAARLLGRDLSEHTFKDPITTSEHPEASL